jgi:hypothetical protein
MREAAAAVELIATFLDTDLVAGLHRADRAARQCETGRRRAGPGPWRGRWWAPRPCNWPTRWAATSPRWPAIATPRPSVT